nr:hypothetical protein BaRGS_033567 [Batillaria attramentaria]
MRNPEEKSSATGCPKAAAQSFADFKPLLRIKPYGDESGGRQQQRSVSPDRAAGKIQTKTILFVTGDNSCGQILHTLKALELRFREAPKTGIAVVQAEWNQR